MRKETKDFIDRFEGRNVGFVFEIRDVVIDEAVIPQFCCKTEEGAKRNFALFLANNKMKPSNFRLNKIGAYNPDEALRICEGSEVLISDYMKDDFEATVSKES